MTINRSSYANLPQRFFAQVSPVPVGSPRLVKFNYALERELGLDVAHLGDQALAELFAGNTPLPMSETIAMAYAGHQFGHFVPQLGDGRAVLLGEVCDRAGICHDIQLKGSGQTPYSRNGDGRAALGPVLREYLVSEAMYALGIPTTRALAAVVSGESVLREEVLPGAILTRVARSFVRVGTFQYFAARNDIDAVRQLADYVIDRHYPQIKAEPRPYLALLQAVTDAQASLIANWMRVGFIHGVMNTDNMAVSGETIDFGPCAFLDTYDPATVFSSIDYQGRYSYSNQPYAGAWDLARFAETLLPIIDTATDRAAELANEVLATFVIRFADFAQAHMRRKLGLSIHQGADAALAEDLLAIMHRNQADFTLTFRGLSDAADSANADEGLRSLFLNPLDYDAWAERWRERLSHESMQPGARSESMRRVNPAVIPRNHRIAQVIEAAIERQDLQPFAELLAVLSQPYQLLPGFESYADPPRAHERVLRTFCGT